MARKIYSVTPERERDEKKKQLARMLSVSKSTIHEWLSRIDKDAKAAREKKVFDMWMACHSMQEIAEAVGVHKDTVSEVCRKFPKLENSDKAVADHGINFDPPIYNVWKQQEKTPGPKHFGNRKFGGWTICSTGTPSPSISLSILLQAAVRPLISATSGFGGIG